jgi:uncharacterized protein YodC (DUF2158 family)
MSIKKGDVVQLKSGGPPMTVESTGGDSVWCVWFDGTKPMGKGFAEHTLKPYEPPPKTKVGAL